MNNNNSGNGEVGMMAFMIGIAAVLLFILLPSFIFYMIFNRVRPEKRKPVIEAGLLYLVGACLMKWVFYPNALMEDFIVAILITGPLFLSAVCMFSDFNGVFGIPDEQPAPAANAPGMTFAPPRDNETVFASHADAASDDQAFAYRDSVFGGAGQGERGQQPRRQYEGLLYLLGPIEEGTQTGTSSPGAGVIDERITNQRSAAHSREQHTQDQPHTDDTQKARRANLWARAKDPASSEAERQMAMKALEEEEFGRTSKTEREIPKRLNYRR